MSVAKVYMCDVYISWKQTAATCKFILVKDDFC